MCHNPRYRNLGQGGRANLGHLLGQNRIGIAVKNLIPVGIVHLHPTAARTRPGEFLGNALHADARHVTDHITQQGRFFTIIDNILIRFVGDDKTFVLFGNGDNLPERLFRINEPGRVVRIDDQDPSHCRIVLDMVLYIFQIRIPEMVGVKDIGNRLCPGVGCLGRRIGSIARGVYNHPGGALQKTINL